MKGGLPKPHHTAPSFSYHQNVNGGVVVSWPGCHGKGSSFESRPSQDSKHKNLNFENLKIQQHQSLKYYSATLHKSMPWLMDSELQYELMLPLAQQ